MLWPAATGVAIPRSPQPNSSLLIGLETEGVGGERAISVAVQRLIGQLVSSARSPRERIAWAAAATWTKVKNSAHPALMKLVRGVGPDCCAAFKTDGIVRRGAPVNRTLHQHENKAAKQSGEPDQRESKIQSVAIHEERLKAQSPFPL